MGKIIELADRMTLGIIKKIHEEIKSIKERLKKLEDINSEILREDLNKKKIRKE